MNGHETDMLRKTGTFRENSTYISWYTDPMPPSVIVWFQSKKKSIQITILVLITLVAAVLYPSFLASYLSYRLYLRDSSLYLTYPIIAGIILVGLSLQSLWVGYLLDKFYPNIDPELLEP